MGALAYASVYVAPEVELGYATRHALDAHAVYRSHGVYLPGFTICMEGYRYDDDNGLSVFLSYDGVVKGSGYA